MAIKKSLTRNKVVLVNAGIHFQEPLSYGMYPNTAIMILASIVHAAGFNVVMVDGRYLTVEDTIRAISKEVDQTLIYIGFSVMTVQVPWAYYVSCALKQLHQDACIVWGGIHPTLFPEQTVGDPAVDLVVINDAAGTIVGLTGLIAQREDLSDFPGICYKASAGILRTPLNRQSDDFNSIPHIDFSLLNHQRYAKNNNIATEEFYAGEYAQCSVYPIITALSCTYRCTFCINVILKRPYHFLPAKEIVERIKFLQRFHGADFIHPLDENFFINRKRVFEFLDLLEKDNIRIKWRPQLRADYFCKEYIDASLAKRLERSGMIVAAMGVESASQEMLDKLKKQLKVEHITRAMEILSKTTIVPKMNFMVGMPGESPQEIKKTYALAVRLRKMVKRSCVTISPFRPYPGSPLYDQIVNEYGYAPPSSLSQWAQLSQNELVDGRGYESFAHYTWIKKPKTLKAFQSVYDEIAWYKPPGDDMLRGKIKYAIAFFRFRFNIFFGLRIERYTLRILARIKARIMRAIPG